jgi:hypothetical protein
VFRVCYKIPHNPPVHTSSWYIYGKAYPLQFPLWADNCWVHLLGSDTSSWVCRHAILYTDIPQGLKHCLTPSRSSPELLLQSFFIFLGGQQVRQLQPSHQYLHDLRIPMVHQAGLKNLHMHSVLQSIRRLLITYSSSEACNQFEL